MIESWPKMRKCGEKKQLVGKHGLPGLATKTNLLD